MVEPPESKILRLILSADRADGFVKIQIKNSGKSLCERCTHLFRMQYSEENEPMMYCFELTDSRGAPSRIHGLVKTCSGFRAKTDLTLSQMKEMAWYIKKEPSGSIGFMKPGDKEYPGNKGNRWEPDS